MPKVESSEFGIKPRLDGQAGHRVITPTTMVFDEVDGSDVRMSRVKVYDENGNLVKTYMLSPMGQKYRDPEDYPDDPKYLESLKPKQHSS